MNNTPDTVERVFAVFVLVIAIVVLAGSAATVKFYAGALRGTPGSGGLRLWHVVVVASGSALTWLTLAVGQASILGLLDTPRAVRLGGYALGGVLTSAAILIIAVSSYRRVTSTPTRRVVTERVVTEGHGTRVEVDEPDDDPSPIDS